MRWYGWQTLLGLLGSHTLMVTGSVSMGFWLVQHPVGNALLIVGTLGDVLSGPIVHWAHGYGWRGVGALAINAGILASITGLTYWIGSATDSCSGSYDGCGLSDFRYITYFTFLTTAVHVPFFDVMMLSYEPRADRSPPKGSFRPSITGVAPLLGQRRTALVITGQF